MSRYLVILILSVAAITFAQQTTSNIRDNQLRQLRAEIAAGNIVYRLSEPEEIKAILGPPQAENTSPDGDMLALKMTYPDVFVAFGKVKNEKSSPFTLQFLAIRGERMNIGEGGPVLRNNSDLKKLSLFEGFQNVSLRKLDLRNELELIRTMNYDDLTEWPPIEMLPAGFDSKRVLEEGKDPGLGVRALHKQGITGKGVGIAIIDQPLLLGHKEYTSRIVRYDTTGLMGVAPQMHGPPVASIAVGRNIGVAPEAALTYLAVPMWRGDNIFFVRALQKVLAWNAELPEDEKIRVVSISTGMFRWWPNFAAWKEALRHAEEAGIFVVTCDTVMLNYGLLNLLDGKDRDDPNSYVAGISADEKPVLRVPAGYKTVANHRGIDGYTYYREAGSSWAAPYIAGLAALAFQVKKDIKPKQITECLIQSATHTHAGPVVNPRQFIELVKQK